MSGFYKRLRVPALVLGLALAAGLLFACGGDGSGSEAPATEQLTEAASNTSPATEQPTEAATTTSPATEQPTEAAATTTPAAEQPTEQALPRRLHRHYLRSVTKRGSEPQTSWWLPLMGSS